ncbi:PTPRT-like protein [Mya arenaria]|uniref:protein-tyrosine-phosphatase n=1 Tax=Mya arenaria TaxID=6604 RepID=A0ABY7E644_MYAAR|nr:PTPRT-like protein [Mya arenaria]
MDDKVGFVFIGILHFALQCDPPDILALWVNTTCMQNYPIKQKVLRVLEHDRLRVECFAAGNPEPTCQWTNHSQSRTLDILKATKEDAGAYVCHAFNTMKTSYGNPPNITNLNRSVEVLEGVNFNLTCEAEPGNSNVTSYYWTSSPLYRPNYSPKQTFKTRPGNKVELIFSVFSNPPPTYFMWTKVSNHMQIPIFSTASGRVIINSTDNMSTALIITNVTSWDYGNYSVRVENEIGYKIETFYIIEDVQSTIADTPQNDKRNGSKYIIAIVGSVCGIAVVVSLLRLWWLKRSTPIHDTNTLQLLRDTRHDSGRMETIFDNVLPINDETPKYEEEKNIYANIQINDAFGKYSTIKTLRDTLRQLKLDPSPLFKQFYTLQMGLKYDTKDALKPNNVAKNRYRNDASRVVLPFLRGDPDSDFINASYIDGYSKPRKYIAAQGPLENTISDTWRMIHSEDIKIIVMVTNLLETVKIKCSKYWPDERATYGKCNVKLDQVEQYADFAIRHFTYSMDGTRFERQLIQFHYTSWPATALSLVQFWRKVRQSEFVENTPWMVHCSAGVGMTGTFIALDYLYDQGKVDEKLNVPETVNVLREQRVCMVQTKEQYLYLHEAILELLDPVGLIFTPESSMRFQSTVTEDRKLIKEFKAITDSIVNVTTVENDNDFDRMPDGQLPENKCKSIDMNVIPDDLFRPLISSGNDFINAVYIPTYRESEKYIVTQFPLQNTTVDFVRLLWDHNIRDVHQSKQTVVHQFTAWPGNVNLCERTTLTEFLQTISSHISFAIP